MAQLMIFLIALFLCLLAIANAQYYGNTQRSYMMASPYGSYATPRTYGPRPYYQQPYQYQTYQRPAYQYAYPQQQQQRQQYNYNYNYPYYNYYQQPQQYSSYSYPRAYSAPTMSIEAGPPNALVSAHLFCMNCGRGRQ